MKSGQGEDLLPPVRKPAEPTVGPEPLPSGDFELEFPAAELDVRPFFDEASRSVPSRAHAVMAAMLNVGSEAFEEFRTVATKTRSLGSPEQPLRCLGIVSASPGEGKTTVAVGLALALAQEPGRRVLLVEADLRKPAIERYLGLSREPGLGDWLEASSGRRIPLRRVVPHGFCLLPAGRFPSRRPELLRSERMARLLEVARQCFDWVILDCPPLVPVADSLMLQDMLDGFLCVVRSRQSPLETIQRALAQVKPGRMRGVIFNDHREVLPSYYNYAQRRYRSQP